MRESQKPKDGLTNAVRCHRARTNDGAQPPGSDALGDAAAAWPSDKFGCDQKLKTECRQPAEAGTYYSLRPLAAGPRQGG